MWALEQNAQHVDSQRDGVVFGDGVVQAVATGQNGQMYMTNNWTQGASPSTQAPYHNAPMAGYMMAPPPAATNGSVPHKMVTKAVVSGNRQNGNGISENGQPAENGRNGYPDENGNDNRQKVAMYNGRAMPPQQAPQAAYAPQYAIPQQPDGRNPTDPQAAAMAAAVAMQHPQAAHAGANHQTHQPTHFDMSAHASSGVPTQMHDHYQQQPGGQLDANG